MERDAAEMEVLAWPDEAARRADLRTRGVPRLLVVAADSPSPDVEDPLEDWVRASDPPADRDARAAALRLRARETTVRPFLDADRVLHHGEGPAALGEPGHSHDLDRP